MPSLRNASIGHRYEQPEFEDIDPCTTCGRIGDGILQSCICGCGQFLHPKCAAGLCFTCEWPVCSDSVTRVGEEVFCPTCAIRARAEMQAGIAAEMDAGCGSLVEAA